MKTGFRWDDHVRISRVSEVALSRKLPKSLGTTKADLVDAVYKRHGALTKTEAAKVVDAIFSTVKTSLSDGRAVRIRNFGTFELAAREGRTGVNPASGEKMFIPPRTGLTFKPSRHLKSVLTDDDGET